MPSFIMGTWNILATAYIRPAYYPHTPAEFLDPVWRVPALVRRAKELAPDILCLQEVERPVFAAFQAGLEGYTGRLAMKAGRKPDGSATFYRTDRCRLIDERRLLYADGTPPSGHVAQVLDLEVEGVRVTLANTHLKWDPPETPPVDRWDYRQARQALAILDESAAPVQILCGDFNAPPDSAVIQLLTARGFRYSHHGDHAYSCNSGGQPKLIDYLCFRGPVVVEPAPLPPIDGDTPLPSGEQPSDHLPLLAKFTSN